MPDFPKFRPFTRPIFQPCLIRATKTSHVCRSQKFSPQAHSKLGKIMSFLKPLLICCSPNFGATSTIFQVFSSHVPENLADIQNFNFQITGLSHIFARFLDDQASYDPKVAIRKKHGRTYNAWRRKWLVWLRTVSCR